MATNAPRHQKHQDKYRIRMGGEIQFTDYVVHIIQEHLFQEDAKKNRNTKNCIATEILLICTLAYWTATARLAPLLVPGLESESLNNSVPVGRREALLSGRTFLAASWRDLQALGRWKSPLVTAPLTGVAWRCEIVMWRLKRSAVLFFGGDPAIFPPFQKAYGNWLKGPYCFQGLRGKERSEK